METEERNDKWKRFAKVALWTGAGAAGAYCGWQAYQKASIQRQNGSVAKGRKIVILGGGFGGAYAARELARLLPGEDNGELILVDEHPYLLFTPMLTEAAGGEISPHHIVSPVRHLPKRVKFVRGRIKGVDLASKTVTVQGANGHPEQKLVADQIVVALGSVSNFHNLPGVEQYSLTMKRLGDAAAVCNRALDLMEKAALEPDEDKRRSMLTFVVAGGGYTGVETMAALNDLVRENAQRYERLRPEEIRTVLIEPEARILREVTPDLAQYAQKKLEERGVEVLLSTKVTGAGPDYVQLEGKRIPTQTLIWSAGVAPNPVAVHMDCEHGKHGGILVDSSFAIKDHPGGWAIGDCAEIPEDNGKGTYAPTAQNATREGVHVARNIVASLRREPLVPFHYTPIGELALVGKRTGVARVYGHNFSGLIAWAMWRGVYLAKMPGVGQRARILADWVLDLAFGRPVAVTDRQFGPETRR